MNVIHYVFRLENKKNYHLGNYRKSIYQNPTSILDFKIPTSLVVEGNALNPNKNIYKKTTLTLCLMWKHRTLTYNFRNNGRIPALTTCIHLNERGSSHCNKGKKKNHKYWKEGNKTILIHKYHDHKVNYKECAPAQKLLEVISKFREVKYSRSARKD